MADRQLLEAAARAAGWPGSAYWLMYPAGSAPVGGHHWNPLEDDADAFRLAVKLGLSVTHMRSERPDVEDHKVCIHDHNVSEFYGTDPCAATRRAIVRAAAATTTTQDKPA